MSLAAHARPIDYSRSGPYFAAFLGLALVAFWPSYLAQVGAASFYTHLHAATATVWMVLLIAQPLAIRAKRLPLHRTLGKASYIVAVGVMLSMLLLAHNRLQGLTADRYAIQTYVLYLQVSLAALFALSYALAIYNRRTTALHARFMVCTALTLVDPVTIRILLWLDPAPAYNPNWVTYGLTDLVFLVLIYLERGTRTGRRVFPIMLAIFVLFQLPALFEMTTAPVWQSFATWFAALRLT